MVPPRLISQPQQVVSLVATRAMLAGAGAGAGKGTGAAMPSDPTVTEGALKEGSVGDGGRVLPRPAGAVSAINARYEIDLSAGAFVLGTYNTVIRYLKALKDINGRAVEETSRVGQQ